MNSWELPIEDLESLRRGLEVTRNHFQARDIAESGRALQPQVEWSPMTLLVEDLFELVDGHIAEYAVARYDDERDAEPAQIGPEVLEIEVDLTDDDDDDPVDVDEDTSGLAE